MTELRTGVVGVGHLGRFHAQKYARISQLQGLYDTDIERAHSVAQELGCRAYDDLETLLGEVDAISIVTPTLHHHRVAKAAIARGIHCLVEKPFTFTLEEADDLIQQAKARA
ncbi:MAG: Gfo/Idh/MocA family oxidoreductase [Gammaproteobacteria bacterium]|nr:Gfo/Idh/MocA family oxidoreductase [Gammaproteobacteria bacterium]